MNASRKNKKKRKPSSSPAKQAKSPAPASESNAAEGVTVAWMLAAMGAGLSELVTMLAMGILAYEPWATQLPERLTVLPWLLLLVALITGSIALLLTPLVLRQRQTPPPQSVINFAVTVGIVAWALFVGSLWF